MRAKLCILALLLSCSIRAGQGRRVHLTSGSAWSLSNLPQKGHHISRGPPKQAAATEAVPAPSPQLRPANAAFVPSSFTAQRRALLAALFGSSVLPVLPPTAQASTVADAVRIFSVASGALDPRKYRGLILANGLRILLASDPNAAKSAAAMNVQVGYMSDPAALPGLAHFCEHMLFLGTKPYPKEGDFERAVTAGGGSNNAYTAPEDTTYFFDVQSKDLQLVLDRFASFFTAPLFTESATSREVNAIDSEHSKNLQSDTWRLEQLGKLRADQSHPYAKFGTGNRQTLREGDNTARAALLEFHERYYQADRMSLALIGPQPLDTLEKFVTTKFAAVPKSNPPLPPSSDAYDGLPIPFRPATAQPEATLMVPVDDLRTLRVAWCMKVTDLEDWLASKPEAVWSLLMSNRGKEGLVPLLKAKGFALDLEPGIEEVTRSFIILALEIALTPLGLAKWRDVVSLTFAYLRKLRDMGVPRTLVQEMRSLTKTDFTYAEPSEPQAWASQKCTQLIFHEPEKWITGPILVEEGTEVGAQYMLEQCAEPTNAIITLIAKEIEAQATLTEPIYGTRYGRLPITKEVNMWRSATIPKEFDLPGPNPFIPTDFSLKCASGGRKCVAVEPNGSIAPQVIQDAPGLRVHFLQDSTFQRPRASTFFLFRSPLLYASPKASVTATLFQAVLGDVLQDATYQAGLAGLSAGFAADYNGIALSASGYNARLPEFVAYVSQQVRTLELPKLAFDRQLDAFRQDLANSNRTQPIGQCAYRRSLALETPRYTIDELAKAAENLKLTDLKVFQKALLPEAYLEAFLAGNLAGAEARKIVEAVRKAIPSSAPLAADKIPRRQVRVLQPGQSSLQQFITPNSEEVNSATEVFLQVGMDEGDNWLLMAVLIQLMQEPFFEELRTKQQLGYIVQCTITESEGVRGFSFIVQSSVVPPPQVEERIDAFLKEYRTQLAALSEAELDNNRESLAVQATDVDKRLNSQTGRLWGEILQRRYDYGRPWRVAQRVRKVTLEQLLTFYDRFIMPGSPQSKRLVIHVFSQSAAPSNLVTDAMPSEFYPAPLEKPLPSAVVAEEALEM